METQTLKTIAIVIPLIWVVLFCTQWFLRSGFTPVSERAMTTMSFFDSALSAPVHSRSASSGLFKYLAFLQNTALAADSPTTTEVGVKQPNRPNLRLIAPQHLIEDYGSLTGDKWLQLGMGYSFTDYAQNVDAETHIHSGGFVFPTVSASAGIFVTNRFAAEFSYQTASGTIASSEDITVEDSAYVLSTKGLEMIYRPTKFLRTARQELLWRLGLHDHQMPLIVPTTTGRVGLYKSHVRTLSFGADYRRLLSNKWRMEAQGRIHFPITSSSEGVNNYAFDSSTTVDGSFGFTRPLNESMTLGFYWNGKYQAYRFLYDDANNVNYSGDQTLIFTNLDLRIGWEF